MRYSGKISQSGGTVRSIPIKNYRASLLQDMETLRRPVVPQQQFESLVSEPERPIRSKRKNCQTVTSSSSKSKTRCQGNNADEKSPKKKRAKEPTKMYSEFIPTFRFLDDPHNCTRAASYFHSSLNNSNHHVNNNNNYKNDSNSELERSNVLQKISVYEGNVRTSGRSSEFMRLSDPERRSRTLGVPLVGMHNACGLPVIGYSWPEQHVTRLCVTNELGGKLGTLPRTYEKKSKIKKKRRAPQPEDIGQRKSRPRTIDGSVTDYNGSIRKKPSRRPSFRNSRINSLPFKQRSYRRMESGQNEKGRVDGSLKRRSFARRSFKRATLYAKDDGSEAVDVLSRLCLNPMARNKGTMIW